MKKFGKFVLAGTALLAAVGVVETVKKLKKDKEEDITGDFRKDDSPKAETESVKTSGQTACAAGCAAPEQEADQAEEEARADRRRKVKDLDDDPFCRLFDELCK